MLNPILNSIYISKKNQERYSRHLIIDEINSEGHKRIQESKIIMIGAGGLNSSGLLYLVACGIGTIGIVDNDTVDISNLQRQIIYKEEHINKQKVQCALNILKRLNSSINIIIYSSLLTKTNIEKIFMDYDIIIDGTDNFYTKYIISQTCYKIHKVHIYGAIEKFTGHVSVFNYQNGPNYFEISHILSTKAEDSCRKRGVLNTLAGITGMIQATEAIKVITGIGNILNGYLLNIDIIQLSFKKIQIKNYTKLIFKKKNYRKTQKQVKYLSLTELNKLNSKSLIIIDVRNNLEFKTKKIKNAINIPLNKLKKNSFIKLIKQKLIKSNVLLYCNNELQSYIASKILNKHQINNYVLRDGINNYNK